MSSKEYKKPTIVWLQTITCNGNTHSLLSANTNRLKLFLDTFELIYHPSLTADMSLLNILEQNIKIDFLLVEGAISSNKTFFQLSTYSSDEILKQLLSKTKYLLAIGSCACYGGIHAKFEQNSNIVGLQDILNQKELALLSHPLINLTGCPVHPEWIFQTLFTLNEYQKIILDKQGRPKEIYSHLTHHGCVRNEYFEWKVEAKSFGLKEGCLFYEQGCRGPMTHSNCNRVLWNDVNTKTRAGMPCIGCTEFDFPRENMLETKKNIGIPAQIPVGISKRAYLSLAGVAKTFKIKRLHERIIK